MNLKYYHSFRKRIPGVKVKLSYINDGCVFEVVE